MSDSLQVAYKIIKPSRLIMSSFALNDMYTFTKATKINNKILNLKDP